MRNTLCNKLFKSTNSNDIYDLINANIIFGNIILENLNKMNVKKFINFSTVWQDFDGKENLPFNLYSATKWGLLKI